MYDSNAFALFLPMESSIRVYPTLLMKAAEVLEAVCIQGKAAGPLVRAALRSDKRMGSRDRKQLGFLIYEGFRHYRSVRFRYQLEEPLDIVAGIAHEAGWSLPKEWADRAFTVVKEPEEFAILHSYPDAFYQLAEKEVGEEWPKQAAAMQTKAPLVLRVNTLKTNQTELVKQLNQEGIDCALDTAYPEAIVIHAPVDLSQHPLFLSGAFEIQDGGSQAIGLFCAPKPQEEILDACAGGAGKSLHLAALSGNKSRIWVSDGIPERLADGKERALRAGAKALFFQDTPETVLQQNAFFDLVLIDAPCTGSGTIRRDPSLKWTITETQLDKVVELQKKILDQYAPLVKPGGRLVYATCSLFASENQNQVAHFLQRNPSFRLDETKQVFPDQGYDGYYMARLIKKD
jgi:16S rRNA (cytosine967-C5)-methyltransferase